MESPTLHHGIRIPMVRAYAELTLSDGVRLTGHMFVEATTRLQDVLNDERLFFPFISEADGFVLVNKNTVARVRPLDD